MMLIFRLEKALSPDEDDIYIALDPTVSDVHSGRTPLKIQIPHKSSVATLQKSTPPLT